MEWDFTPTQVMKGEVAYTLENFLEDLKVEITHNFHPKDDATFDRMLKVTFGVVYLTSIGKDVQTIHETSGVPEEIIEYLLKNNQPNTEMLEHILMGMFIKNLEESGGILSDEDNRALLNSQLFQFHSKHHLWP